MSKSQNAPLILDNRQVQGNATVYAKGNLLVCVKAGNKRTFVEMVNDSTSVAQNLANTALFLGVNIEIDAIYRKQSDGQHMKAGDMGRDETSATNRDAAETAIHNFLHDKNLQFRHVSHTSLAFFLSASMRYTRVKLSDSHQS